VLALALVLGACGDSTTAVPTAAPTGTPGTVVSALSRANADAAPHASSLTVDPAALRDVLARVPAPLPPTSASGTLVGTDTRLPASSATPTTDGAGESVLLDLRTKLAPSNAGSERDLRATLYFDLVDRCRDDKGQHLPPESVMVRFRVDAHGQIDRASVQTRPLAPAFAAAAECMARVIRTSDARFTPARLGQPIAVSAKVPSVD
jgi:hypothetical protein